MAENKPKTEPNATHSPDNRNNLKTTNGNDYQILIGDNSFNASSSQSSYVSDTNSDDNKVYRNYISSPHHFLLILFLIIYVLLILLGASVFSLFEQKAEFQIRDQLLRTQQTFLAKHPCVDAESLDAFVESVIKSLDSGVNLHQLNQILRQSERHNQKVSQTHPPQEVTPKSINPITDKPDSHIKEYKSDTKESKFGYYSKSETKARQKSQKSEMLSSNIPTEYSNWEFTSSLMFVTSVVTTIGYGHVTPITVEGKVFCLIFSCVAIPFTLNGPIRIFEKWLIRTISSHFQNTRDFFIRVLHVLIVTITLLLLILIFPAFLFSYMEKEWSFLDAIYYCYISLTTVGLGDFVATTSDVQ
ncbi:unnamed protein product [Oppiella nova]|uniref:Potassium channel domain-containing protein n=1 Tax=Oppiella nova TaxID=334625 RepID=A0A7R9L9L6_9ACAR|nr:unnamed protein product [Oppiella nova]CAG2161029.1 unnamed protein product [Oppiella nova]